jgi:pantetheine-phosphate adenylyltransferase
MFDAVIVAVARNPGKKELFDADTRVHLARAALAADPATSDVRAEVVPGLVVDFCREVGATVLVKGLRGGGDFDAELPMALMNRHLAGVETVFVAAGLPHIASSLVKDIAQHGGAIDDLVPANVAAAVRVAYGMHRELQEEKP